MTDSQHDPYRLQKLLLDRRAFIGVSAAGLGSLLLAGCSDGGRAGNQAQILDTGTGTTPSGGGIHHLPYGLDVSSSLSEDHFLLKTAKIDPSKDTVVAYSRLDGLVEALLLQNGVISQVYRDPTVVGGWNVREIASGALDMVAGLNAGSSFRQYQLHLFYRSTSGQMHHLLEAAPDANGISSGSFNVEDSFDWGTGGKLGLSTNFDQELLAYCLTPSSAAGKKDATLHYYYVTSSYGLGVNDRTQGNATGFEFDGGHAGLGGTALAAVAQKGIANILIYVPSPGRPSVDIYSFGAGSAQGMSVSGNATPLAGVPINRSKTNSVAVPNFPAGVTIRSIDYAYEPSFGEPPVAIVHTADQRLLALSSNQTATAWLTQDLKVPAPPSGQTLSVQPSALRVPHQATSGLLANFFTVAAGRLSVLRQLEQDPQTDAESPVFNPAVPLQTGVQGLSSQIRASAGDELIAVSDDGNLQMLAWTSDGGWTSTEIHLPATEPIAADTYRVQLTLTDAWGLPVTGQTLSVTSSGPVFVLVGGQSVSLSDTATSFITDTQGQVTLPLLADGLSAPMLTVSGASLQYPIQVSPSESVNSYMQGKKPLNFMPKMDGSALQNATAADGTYVFPAAHGDPSVASDAAGVLTNAAIAGANPSDHSGQQQTIGSIPPGANATVEVQGIVLSFDKLAHDAAYAIKTGAAKVKQVAIQWDDDAKRWVSQATADFDNWAEQTLNTVINGLEDAAHVFHSVINHLGAEIVKALKWLELEVLKLLADAVTLAGHYEDWLKSLTTTGTDLLGKAKTHANGWFAAQQTGVEKDMNKLKSLLGSRSIGSLEQPPSSISSAAVASDDDASSQSSTTDSHWLLQKVTLDNPPAPAAPSVSEDLKTLLADVKTHAGDSWDHFEQAAHDFLDTVGSLVSNPKDFDSVGIDKLLDAFAQLIESAIAAVNLVIDVVIDLLTAAVSAFGELISTPLNDLPLVSPLLKAAGMTRPLTIGGLVSLLVAFPTVLSYKIAHLSYDAIPFKGTSSTGIQDAATESSVADDLNFTTASVGAFWGFVDLFEIPFNAGNTDAPAFFNWMDMICPAISAALTMPSHDQGLPFTSTIKLDDTADVTNAVFWATGAIPATFIAVKLILVAKYGAEDGEAAAEGIPWLTTLDGVLGALFGIFAAIELDLADPPAAALTAANNVLGSTGYALEIANEKAIVEGTEGISAVLGGLIGSVCSIASSVMSGFGIG